MINFTSRTKYFLKSTPTDMRKGYEGLASIVREVMNHNPRNYNEAFVFYSKDYRKITHELSIKRNFDFDIVNVCSDKN